MKSFMILLVVYLIGWWGGSLYTKLFASHAECSPRQPTDCVLNSNESQLASPAPESTPPSQTNTIPMTSKAALRTSSDFRPNLPKYSTRCTAAQALRIAAQEPIKNSNCPDKSKWMPALIRASANNSNAVLMWIGCNRGDDLATHMRAWSGNTSYSTKFMEPYFTQFQGPRSCPLETYSNITSNISAAFLRPARGFCVEAMTSTYQVVSQMYKELAWDANVQVIHAAASSSPGYTDFPRNTAGFEAFGIGSNAQGPADRVQVITVDGLTEKYNLQSIDILSIDTEGNDMRVIFGAIHTLPIVKYLEFEYHSMNRWANSDLQDLIDLLDQFGFECFWGGNRGQLWRLTGCWHDSYYPKRYWSNVVCPSRSQKQLYETMLEHAQKFM